MREEQLKKSLNELAKATAEPVRPNLAEDIKNHIPGTLNPHRHGMDTINIIIDLRINKLAAAAIIITMMILLASFFSGQDSLENGIYQDSKMLLTYILRSRIDRSDLLSIKSRYSHLLSKGVQAEYYGDKEYLNDSNAVLLQWKLPNGNYTIITGDLRERTVSPEELIELLGKMLQEKI